MQENFNTLTADDAVLGKHISVVDDEEADVAESGTRTSVGSTQTSIMHLSAPASKTVNVYIDLV